MCGIAGYIHLDPLRYASAEKLNNMVDVLSHRGPDGKGIYVNKNIALGHSRLSIIDLDTGNQPMFNDDREIILTFNGEIYNYKELREELKKKGHNFHTTSDTEVVIKAYEEWSTNCFLKFNGMWGLALWDNRKKQLIISRDRVGEKPLYYAKVDNTFIFSSEIKGIFQYGIKKTPRLELIEIYLFCSNIPAPYTFFENIYKLLPGHFLTIDSSGEKDEKYWDLPEINEDNMIRNEKDVFSSFTDLLNDSVNLRTRSDVPFGAFLSGGLDSSTIVGIMTDICAEQVQTFTVKFHDKLFDESNYAKLVSDKFKTNHHVCEVSFQDIQDLLNITKHYFDEPFGDSSAIPTYYVSKLAQLHVKMVLTGDGGDEALSGYKTYLGIKLLKYFENKKHLITFINQVSKAFNSRSKNSIISKLNEVKTFINTSQLGFLDRLIIRHSFYPMVRIKQLTASLKNQIPIEDYFSDILRNCNYKDDFYKQMYINYKYDLPDDYLVKVDRMSMANSIETRTPFLDYRLIEYMVHVDQKIKLKNFQLKYILKNTFGKGLPQEIINLPKKGFVIPLRDIYKNPEFTTFKNIKTLFSGSLIDGVVSDNKTGHKDFGQFLWSLSILEKILE